MITVLSLSVLALAAIVVWQQFQIRSLGKFVDQVHEHVYHIDQRIGLVEDVNRDRLYPEFWNDLPADPDASEPEFQGEQSLEVGYFEDLRPRGDTKVLGGRVTRPLLRITQPLHQ